MDYLSIKLAEPVVQLEGRALGQFEQIDAPVVTDSEEAF